jgi:hypothetical protein
VNDRYKAKDTGHAQVWALGGACLTVLNDGAGFCGPEWDPLECSLDLDVERIEVDVANHTHRTL